MKDLRDLKDLTIQDGKDQRKTSTEAPVLILEATSYAPRREGGDSAAGTSHRSRPGSVTRTRTCIKAERVLY